LGVPFFILILYHFGGVGSGWVMVNDLSEFETVKKKQGVISQQPILIVLIQI
jgi:hypothetical protein